MRPWLVAQYELPIKNHSWIFRIDPHAAFAAPDEYENMYPGIASPFIKGS